MTFPERLNQLQQGWHIDKQAIYKAVGLSRTAYFRYERGEREPPMSILISLANYFNVSIDYLVGRTDNPEINR